MSDKVKATLTGNIEIQHYLFSKDEREKRINCVGIWLEVIKTCAAAGAHPNTIEGMLENLEESAEKIMKALDKQI